MITYQQNTRFSQAVECGRETFWGCIRNATTQRNIDSRRDILDVVKRHDAPGIARWLKQADYQKFLYKKQSLKPRARENFLAKSDEERLLAFAGELKTNLPAFIFSCREFDATPSAKGTPFRHRRLKDCHLNGLVMLDIDHVENPRAVWERLQQQEELLARTKLVHITSSREGIRIVFTASLEAGNLADNQTAFAQALGYQADGSCIDATRNSFAPKEEDILYIDETLFEYYDEVYDKTWTPRYRGEEKTLPQRTLPQPLPGREGSGYLEGHAQGSEDGSGEMNKDGSGDGSKDGELRFRGMRYKDIIEEWWRRTGGEPVEGERNVRLYHLAVNLRAICDNSAEKLLAVLPRLGLSEEEMQQIVSSACKETPKGVSKLLMEVMQGCIADTQSRVIAPSLQGRAGGESGSLGESLLPLSLWGSQIESLFDEFPQLRDICHGLKRNQYPAALFVGGSLLMTLMTRCTYRFYHRPKELRRLNNATFIIGDPACGKSFAEHLYKVLSAPIVEADQPGRDALNAYRESYKKKGENKEKPTRPKVLLRTHPARTSNNQFIQDMVNSTDIVDGVPMQLHLLSFDSELDNTLSVQRGGTWIDKHAMELKAFHNEIDGQAYSNADSVIENFMVTWNFLYTGTPIALKKKVNPQNFGSGLATRLTCIPLPPTNFEMMERERWVEGEEDADQRLDMWARRLDKMKGTLTLDKIVDELYDWTSRRMEDARENQSRADEMLLKRCAYHGVNFAAPFIVMRHWDAMHKEGDYWCGGFDTDETDWRLAELIVNIQFACQRHFFGYMAEQYFEEQLKEASVNVRRSQKTIEAFRRLPEEFMVEDVMRCFQLAEQSARTRIMRLMRDHLAERKGDAKGEGCVKAVYRKTGVMM